MQQWWGRFNFLAATSASPIKIHAFMISLAVVTTVIGKQDPKLQVQFYMIIHCIIYTDMYV